jgi:hypothetical protein
MNAVVRLKALGLSDIRIAELLGATVPSREEFVSDPPATTATSATTTQPEEAVLGWATALVEGVITYAGPFPVRFLESPLVPVQVFDPVNYARRWLQTLAFARVMVETGGFGPWGRDYYESNIAAGLAALQAMQTAMK